MINVFVLGTSTIHVPSTATSATTGFAGFLEHAALWARLFIDKHDGLGARADWCGDWCADY